MGFNCISPHVRVWSLDTMQSSGNPVDRVSVNRLVDQALAEEEQTMLPLKGILRECRQDKLDFLLGAFSFQSPVSFCRHPPAWKP